MKVIIIKNHKGVGKVGDIKEVPEGFAQNFLFPNKIAVLATKEQLEKIVKNKIEVEKNIENKKNILKSQLEKINNQTITFNKKVNSVGGLFSAISEKEIKDQIKNTLGVSIPEEMIGSTHDLKHTGEFTLKIGSDLKEGKYHIIIKIIGQ